MPPAMEMTLGELVLLDELVCDVFVDAGPPVLELELACVDDEVDVIKLDATPLPLVMLLLITVIVLCTSVESGLSSFFASSRLNVPRVVTLTYAQEGTAVPSGMFNGKNETNTVEQSVLYSTHPSQGSF